MDKTLTHWGRVTHICISKQTIIGSDNGLLPGQRQDIIWTSAGIVLIRTLGTNFSEILSEIRAFENGVCKMASILSQPQCVNSFRLRTNGCLFSDGNFECVFFNENLPTLI